MLLWVLPNEKKSVKKTREQVLSVVVKIQRFDFVNPRR